MTDKKPAHDSALADECDKWAREMHRSADALMLNGLMDAEQGNRDVANLLENCAKLFRQTPADNAMREALEYRFGKWAIDYDPPPIPARNCDWHYTHEDDDGAPDGSSARSGHAGSLQACLDAIAEMIDEALSTPAPQPADDLVGALKLEKAKVEILKKHLPVCGCDGYYDDGCVRCTKQKLEDEAKAALSQREGG